MTLTDREKARIELAKMHRGFYPGIGINPSDFIPTYSDDALITKLIKHIEPPIERKCENCRFWKMTFINTGYGAMGKCGILSTRKGESNSIAIVAVPDEFYALDECTVSTNEKFGCNQWSAND